MHRGHDHCAGGGIRLGKLLSSRGEPGWLQPKSPLRNLYDRAHLVLRFCDRRASRAASLNDHWWLVAFGNLSKVIFTGKILKTAVGGHGDSDSAVVKGTRGVAATNQWRTASLLMDSAESCILVQAWKLSEAAVALEEHEAFIPAENVHVERVLPNIEFTLWQPRLSDDVVSRRLALVPYRPGEGNSDPDPDYEPESPASQGGGSDIEPEEPVVHPVEDIVSGWYAPSSSAASSEPEESPTASIDDPASAPPIEVPPPVPPPPAPPIADRGPAEGGPRGERNTWDKIWCGTNGYMLCSYTQERDCWDIRAICKVDTHKPCSFTFWVQAQ